MKYIIISELNKNHFLFLTYFIISFAKEINNRYITPTDDIIQTFNKYYIYSLSDFLTIIPLIIIKIRSKGISKEIELVKEDIPIEKPSISDDTTETKNRAESSFNIEYIYSDIRFSNDQKRKKRIFKLSILVSIFEFLALYLNVTYNIITKSGDFNIKKIKVNSTMLFNIISKCTLSILILHLPIYKHHYLSLGINLIFLIGLVIIDILGIEDIKSILYMLMKIVKIILFSFEDVYTKVLLSINSASPYNYLLYRGICVNILSFLYSLVFIFVELPDEKGNKSIVFTRFWKVYDHKLNILLYVLLFFIKYLLDLNLFLIIDKFSPIHFAVASIFENFGTLLISIIYKDIKIEEFFIKLAIYFIIILAALIYNEFIVLNFCGFQKHTKLFLQRNASMEQINNINNINNIDNDIVSEDENINKNEIINIEDNLNNEHLEENLIEN